MLYQDLSKLNRNPAQVLYVSAHALESCLQPENCVTVKPWKLETDDTELLDLIPFLECKFTNTSPVSLKKSISCLTALPCGSRYLRCCLLSL